MNSSNSPNPPNPMAAEQAKMVLRIVRIVGVLLSVLGATILLGADFIDILAVFNMTERMIFGGVLLMMGISDLIIVPRLLESKLTNKGATTRDTDR